MNTILHNIAHLIDTYDQTDFEPDELAADGGVTVGAILMKEMRDALDRISARVCRTCEGAGFVANPNARYTMDYVENHPTGIYSTADPEEIDCSDCGGVGFIKRTPMRPPSLPPMDEEIAF